MRFNFIPAYLCTYVTSTFHPICREVTIMNGTDEQDKQGNYILNAGHPPVFVLSWPAVRRKVHI